MFKSAQNSRLFKKEFSQCSDLLSSNFTGKDRLIHYEIYNYIIVIILIIIITVIIITIIICLNCTQLYSPSRSFRTAEPTVTEVALQRLNIQQSSCYLSESL